MKTIRYRSRGEDVHYLEEILTKLGYNVYVSNYFGRDTDGSVRDFQNKNGLVVDGIVGLKTWSKLIEAERNLIAFNDKFLSENDIQDFAQKFNLEVAMVKAVNEIESRGKGFLLGGKPIILFEGHVFWRELVKRGVNPKDYLSEDTKDVLYKKWTRKYYKGGVKEYDRLEKAAGISNLPAFHEAAYTSASWGMFQIMGFHYKHLGYSSVDQFVSAMYEHEREHLKAFGNNGPGYRRNRYDTKLKNAYDRYSVD